MYGKSLRADMGTPAPARPPAELGSVERLLQALPVARTLFFLGVDGLLVVLAFVAALALRMSGVPVVEPAAAVAAMALLLAATLASFHLCGVYNISWSFVGLRDLARVGAGVAFSTLAVAAFSLLPAFHALAPGIPRTVILIQAPILFCGAAAFRLAKRAARAFALTRETRKGARTLLVGAGEAGAQVARSIQATGASYHVLGFIDDDRLSHGTRIQGIPVLGPIASLGRHLATLRAECVIVCVTSADSRFVRDIVRVCRENGVETVRIVPPLSQIVDGKVNIQSTREVSLEDLLGREPVRIDHAEIRELLRGRRVLVTGAAGTIGAELCRQIARFEPHALVAADIDETRLFDLAVDLRQAHPHLRLVEALLDVRNAGDVERLMARERPHVVFHAAAYKHVPMMELHPLAAVETNVLGTLHTAEAAEAHGCERFVLISTDKAVEPSSIMGATKRLAEVALLSGGSASTSTMVRSLVRFGNVIGSRGSVIPIFERQIQRGGPLTVTHPEIRRFFMMTSEAVSLVLQSAVLGRGGDTFVLDMGKPVRILDVAEEFIRLHGLRPHEDIGIEITGLRPGEKLEEVLTYRHEKLVGTRHGRILRVDGAVAEVSPAEMFARLEGFVRARDAEGCRATMHAIFPTLVGDAPDAPPAPTAPRSPPRATLK